MPRDLKTNPAMGSRFKEKCTRYNLSTVLILTESDEFQKYAGADLEEFYKSIPINIIHRPIVDFSLPAFPDIVKDIKV